VTIFSEVGPPPELYELRDTEEARPPSNAARSTSGIVPQRGDNGHGNQEQRTRHGGRSRDNKGRGPPRSGGWASLGRRVPSRDDRAAKPADAGPRPPRAPTR
jgi:hypothetical protein